MIVHWREGITCRDTPCGAQAVVNWSTVRGEVTCTACLHWLDFGQFQAQIIDDVTPENSDNGAITSATRRQWTHGDGALIEDVVREDYRSESDRDKVKAWLDKCCRDSAKKEAIDHFEEMARKAQQAIAQLILAAPETAGDPPWAITTAREIISDCKALAEKLPPMEHRSIESTGPGSEHDDLVLCGACSCAFHRHPTCPSCGATDLSIGSADRNEIENPEKAPEDE